jgi:hypothetical protein
MRAGLEKTGPAKGNKALLWRRRSCCRSCWWCGRFGCAAAVERDADKRFTQTADGRENGTERQERYTIPRSSSLHRVGSIVNEFQSLWIPAIKNHGGGISETPVAARIVQERAQTIAPDEQPAVRNDAKGGGGAICKFHILRPQHERCDGGDGCEAVNVHVVRSFRARKLEPQHGDAVADLGDSGVTGNVFANFFIRYGIIIQPQDGFAPAMRE